eukprot:scaffold26463_cov25-Prasinocladus_malaysianus.AAC.4
MHRRRPQLSRLAERLSRRPAPRPGARLPLIHPCQRGPSGRLDLGVHGQRPPALVLPARAKDQQRRQGGASTKVTNKYAGRG